MRARALATGIGDVAGGVLVCSAIALASHCLQAAETKVFGRVWLEPLVLAILAGAAIRQVWTPAARWAPGIAFSAKTLLEIAIVLLGVTIRADKILASGAGLLAAVVAVVLLSLAASYGLGRLFGLPRRMAMLIACGNSICGNSAIAAVAPVIGARCDDVAASIAFTAVLGVAVVLSLPFLSIALHLSPQAFGVFAGLTVYAVPQVLAATAPVSTLSAQIGALVKLVRVLMLGPVVATLAVIAGCRATTGQDSASNPLAQKRPPDRLRLNQIVPWFIIGFLGLTAARAAGLVPLQILEPATRLSASLTTVAMAALGLGVDVRMVATAGARVAAVVTLSLLILVGLALLALRALALW